MSETPIQLALRTRFFSLMQALTVKVKVILDWANLKPNLTTVKPCIKLKKLIGSGEKKEKKTLIGHLPVTVDIHIFRTFTVT